MNENKKPEQKKRPTAQKRMDQNLKKREIHRSFKSRVRTTINAFQKVLSGGDQKEVENALKGLYSIIDKGVKKRIYKKNKAARLKRKASLFQKSPS